MNDPTLPNEAAMRHRFQELQAQLADEKERGRKLVEAGEDAVQELSENCYCESDERLCSPCVRRVRLQNALDDYRKDGEKAALQHNDQKPAQGPQGDEGKRAIADMGCKLTELEAEIKRLRDKVDAAYNILPMLAETADLHERRRLVLSLRNTEETPDG